MSRRSSWHYLSPSTPRIDAPIAATRASAAKFALRGAAPRRYSVHTPRTTVNHSARERTEPLRIAAPARADFQAILSPEALEFLAALHAEFGGRVGELLQARVARKRRIEAGERLDFLPATRGLREAEWRVAPIP